MSSAVEELVAGLAAEPWGQTSPSTYETGRLVTLAPWLTGHSARVAHLLRTQRPDGGWGGFEAYAVVPTLSATEALLATLHRVAAGRERPADPARLGAAAQHGLARLRHLLRAHSRVSIPDLPAVELIVPALVAAIDGHLADPATETLPGVAGWAGTRLGLPHGMDDARLRTLRSRLAAGAAVPEKLHHALEVVPEHAAGATGVGPRGPGTVGASPAATAAWLGGHRHPGSAAAEHARRHLAEVGAHGPVPCGVPITEFERGWVFYWLAQAGLAGAVPTGLAAELAGALGPAGTPAGPGLPCDADTTSVAIYALGRLGHPVSPEPLWAFEAPTHFRTWPGEDGLSVTVNAHVLEAFGQHSETSGGVSGAPDPRSAPAIGRLSALLVERQRADGSWADRWHASPYYATACCVLALRRFGRGPGVAEALARAVRWARDSQESDGSWGRWSGTVEETAYAVHILATDPDPATTAALAKARPHLADGMAGTSTHPPLWHDKDLYSPAAIVRATVLGALRLTGSRTGLVEMSGRL